MEEGRMVALDDDLNPLPSDYARRFFNALDLWQGREVIVSFRSPPHSRQASGYYWGVVIKYLFDAFKEAGHAKSSEQIHRHFKMKYLPVRVYAVFDVEYVEEPSTSGLDSTDFYDYIESIRNDEDVLALLAALEWPPIPDPDPNYKSYRIQEP